MSITTRSRYQFSTLLEDEYGNKYLTDPVPFRYRDLPDNIFHIVKEGDTLHNLAARYYRDLANLPIVSAANYYWAIADYQPEPIIDPTCKLEVGRMMVIPSTNTLRTQILQRPRSI